MVLLQPLHVGLQGLGGLVPSPGIHGDSDSPGKLLVDASELRRAKERMVSASHSSQQPGRDPSTASTGYRVWRKARHQLRDELRHQQMVSWCILVLKMLLGL